MKKDTQPCRWRFPVWSNHSWSLRQRPEREQEGGSGSQSLAWKYNYFCNVSSLLDPECNPVCDELSVLATSYSCGRARTHVWSEAVPDSAEESPAPPACPGGADAAYSATKRTIQPKTCSKTDTTARFLPPPRRCRYLGLCSQVDDGVEGNVSFTLLQDPGVAVLVNTPLCFCQVTALKEVGCKHVPLKRTRISLCSLNPSVCLQCLRFVYLSE